MFGSDEKTKWLEEIMIYRVAQLRYEYKGWGLNLYQIIPTVTIRSCYFSPTPHLHFKNS